MPGNVTRGSNVHGSVLKSIKLKDRHYSIGLPLSKGDTEFPNNCCVTEQRALNLKKKFSKNRKLCEEYKMFMAKILDKAFAVKVSPVEKAKASHSKRVWYIPHHSVCHPKKQKLRLVFDCGVTYQGMCLSSQFLQGPVLTLWGQELHQ